MFRDGREIRVCEVCWEEIVEGTEYHRGKALITQDGVARGHPTASKLWEYDACEAHALSRPFTLPRLPPPPAVVKAQVKAAP
jgi:hypothetical protein